MAQVLHANDYTSPTERFRRNLQRNGEGPSSSAAPSNALFGDGGEAARAGPSKG